MAFACAEACIKEFEPGQVIPFAPNTIASKAHRIFMARVKCRTAMLKKGSFPNKSTKGVTYDDRCNHIIPLNIRNAGGKFEDHW